MANYLKYINSRKLTKLAERIAYLEDEFRVCLTIGKKDRAAFIECAMGECYKLMMHEVRKSGLKSIEITRNQVKVTFNKIPQNNYI